MSEYIFVTNIFEYSNIRIYSSHSDMHSGEKQIKVNSDNINTEEIHVQSFSNLNSACTDRESSRTGMR